jgi:CubicO group peptidase (beta-lactamase class C family)
VIRRRRNSFTIALLAVPTVAAILVSSLRGAEPDLGAKLVELMEVRSRRGAFSGAVLVARHGAPLLRRAYGMANLELDVPNTPETRFRIGSLTKQFTAAAVLLLQEEGKLDVRQTVKAYLSDAPRTWDEVTVRHLLTHTSGIPDYSRFPDRERAVRQPVSPEGLLARFKDRPLEFKPGARFAYSNSGYAVLGRIIEELSGTSYGTFLRDKIFTPLAMNDSGYDDARLILKHRASGYSRRPQGTENAGFVDMSNPYAAGGLYSTVDDLLKWDRALASGALLSKPSEEAMFTPYLQDYGYGWRIVSTFGRRMVAHPGGIEGFSSHIRRYPDDGVCIVVLSNVDGTPAAELGTALAAVVFGSE